MVSTKHGKRMRHSSIDDNSSYILFVQPGDRIFCRDQKDFDRTLRDIVTYGATVIVTPELMSKFAFEIKEVKRHGSESSSNN